MDNLKGFSVLRVLIVVGIFVALWAGATFFRYHYERQEMEKVMKIMKE